MLRIMLADILLLIGIIIADPLFFHHRSKLRPTTARRAACRTSTLRTGSTAHRRTTTLPGTGSTGGTTIGLAIGIGRTAIRPSRVGGTAVLLIGVRGAAIRPRRIGGTAIRPRGIGRTAIGLLRPLARRSGTHSLRGSGHWPRLHGRSGSGLCIRLGRFRFRRSGLFLSLGCLSFGRSRLFSCLGSLRLFFRLGGLGLRHRLFRFLFCHRRSGSGLFFRLGRFRLFLGLRRSVFFLRLFFLGHGRGSLSGFILVRHRPGLGMLLSEQLLFFLAFPGALFFLIALEFGFLLPERLHHRVQILLNPGRILQNGSRLLINFLCGFRQFHLGHSTLAPPHLALFCV